MKSIAREYGPATSLPRRVGLGILLGATLLGGCSADNGSPKTDPATGQSSVDPLAAVRWATSIASTPDIDVGPLVKQTNKSWACASCHGSQGQGSDQIPALAGLPAGYIAKQLQDFADGTRKNADMAYVARRLTDQEMAALGSYYAGMTREAPAGADLGGNTERGRTLAISGDWRVTAPACFSCHGSSGWGVGQAFPPIAGQHPEYLYRQLVAFETGRRGNDPENFMHDVARVLSDADKRAVADYLASRPPRQVADGVAFRQQPSDTSGEDQPARQGAAK